MHISRKVEIAVKELKKNLVAIKTRAKFSFYYKRALTQNNNTSYSSSKDTFLVLIKVALFWH